MAAVRMKLVQFTSVRKVMPRCWSIRSMSSWAAAVVSALTGLPVTKFLYLEGISLCRGAVRQPGGSGISLSPRGVDERCGSQNPRCPVGTVPPLEHSLSFAVVEAPRSCLPAAGHGLTESPVAPGGRIDLVEDGLGASCHEGTAPVAQSGVVVT